MSTTMILLAILAAAVSGTTLGVAVHAWFTRQKSSLVNIDKLKLAAELIHSVATSQADAHIIAAAQARQAETAFALAQLGTKVAPLLGAATAAPTVQ